MKENINQYKDNQKIDAEDMAKEMEKLSSKEKEKIYYMIQGAALVSTPEGQPEAPTPKAI